MATTISIIIPAFSEQSRIQQSITELNDYISNHPQIIEALYIIEPSEDRTLELAGSLTRNLDKVKVVDNKIKKGKGFAVKNGMLMAQGETVFFMDLDLATPLVEIECFVDFLEKNPETDIVIASRREKEEKKIVSQPFLRKLSGMVFNFFVQLLVLRGYRDTQCGFKAFRKDCAQKIFSQLILDGFCFDVEVLLIAKREGFKVKSLPISWCDRSGSKTRLGRDSLLMVRDLLTLRRRFVGKIA